MHGIDCPACIPFDSIYCAMARQYRFETWNSSLELIMVSEETVSIGKRSQKKKKQGDTTTTTTDATTGATTSHADVDADADADDVQMGVITGQALCVARKMLLRRWCVDGVRRGDGLNVDSVCVDSLSWTDHRETERR